MTSSLGTPRAAASGGGAGARIVAVCAAGGELFLARSHQLGTGPWFAFSHNAAGKLAFSQRGACSAVARAVTAPRLRRHCRMSHVDTTAADAVDAITAASSFSAAAAAAAAAAAPACRTLSSHAPLLYARAR